MQRRTLVLLAVGVFAFLGAACDDSPARYEADFQKPPYARGIEVGNTYNYSVWTHCGIRATRIDGASWRASPPLDDGNGNPPQDWPNGAAIGTLKIVSRNKAVFTTGDLSATFVRDPSMKPLVCA